MDTSVPASATLATNPATPLPLTSRELSQSPKGDIRVGRDDYGKLIDNNGHEFQVPNYTIKDIRDAIPPHCYERKTLRSLGYVARDVILLILNFALFNGFATAPAMQNPMYRSALWFTYSMIQGFFATGLWVLSHECGHQAFSPYKRLNDTVGWILHSALLVPYFSWKISHGKHHKATGHMERDMVFVPRTREKFAQKVRASIEELSHITEDTPIHSLLYLIARQLFGWPLYLLLNETGHDCHERQPEGRGRGKRNGPFGGVNHFNSDSPLFEARDAKWILLSDVGILITATCLFLLAQSYGWRSIAVWYFMPYLWVNHWLVAITFLQHTDPSLPHYDSTSWSFIRGAASTIDRDFGFIGRHLFHGIIETHVLHHYVSTIPFYHAEEATSAIKSVMEGHYRSDTKDGSLGFLTSLFRNVRSCQWVEPSEGARGEGEHILFYRNRNHIGVAPAELKR